MICYVVFLSLTNNRNCATPSDTDMITPMGEHEETCAPRKLFWGHWGIEHALRFLIFETRYNFERHDFINPTRALGEAPKAPQPSRWLRSTKVYSNLDYLRYVLLECSKDDKANFYIDGDTKTFSTKGDPRADLPWYCFHRTSKGNLIAVEKKKNYGNDTLTVYCETEEMMHTLAESTEEIILGRCTFQARTFTVESFTCLVLECLLKDEDFDLGADRFDKTKQENVMANIKILDSKSRDDTKAQSILCKLCQKRVHFPPFQTKPAHIDVTCSRFLSQCRGSQFLATRLEDQTVAIEVLRQQLGSSDKKLKDKTNKLKQQEKANLDLKKLQTQAIEVLRKQLGSADKKLEDKTNKLKKLKDITLKLTEAERKIKAAHKAIIEASTKAASAELQYETVSENTKLKNERVEFRKEMKEFQDSSLKALADEKIEQTLFSKALAMMYKQQLAADKQLKSMLEFIGKQDNLITHAGGGIVFNPLYPRVPAGFDDDGKPIFICYTDEDRFNSEKKIRFAAYGVKPFDLYNAIVRSPFEGEVEIENASSVVYLITGPKELTLCRNLELRGGEHAVGTLDGGEEFEFGGVIKDFYQPYRHAFPVLEDFQTLLAGIEDSAVVDLGNTTSSGSIEIFLRDGEQAYNACPLFISLPKNLISIVGTPATITPNAFATNLLRADVAVDANYKHALVCCWAVATALTPYVSIIEKSNFAKIWDKVPGEDAIDNAINPEMDFMIDEDTTSAAINAEAKDSCRKRPNVDQMPTERLVKRPPKCELTWFTSSDKSDLTTVCVVCGEVIDNVTECEEQTQLEKVGTYHKNGERNNYRKQLSTHRTACGCKLWCIYKIIISTVWSTENYVFFKLGNVYKEPNMYLTLKEFEQMEGVLRILDKRINHTMNAFAKDDHSSHKNLWSGTTTSSATSKISGSVEQPFPTKHLTNFLEGCNDYITKVGIKLKGYLCHGQFGLRIAKKFTTERFINDLNLAMCSHEAFESFCSNLDRMLD